MKDFNLIFLVLLLALMMESLHVRFLLVDLGNNPSEYQESVEARRAGRNTVRPNNTIPQIPQIFITPANETMPAARCKYFKDSALAI